MKKKNIILLTCQFTLRSFSLRLFISAFMMVHFIVLRQDNSICCRFIQRTKEFNEANESIDSLKNELEKFGSPHSGHIQLSDVLIWLYTLRTNSTRSVPFVSRICLYVTSKKKQWKYYSVPVTSNAWNVYPPWPGGAIPSFISKQKLLPSSQGYTKSKLFRFQGFYILFMKEIYEFKLCYISQKKNNQRSWISHDRHCQPLV